MKKHLSTVLFWTGIMAWISGLITSVALMITDSHYAPLATLIAVSGLVVAKIFYWISEAL